MTCEFFQVHKISSGFLVKTRETSESRIVHDNQWAYTVPFWIFGVVGRVAVSTRSECTQIRCSLVDRDFIWTPCTEIPSFPDDALVY
ncbi:hypothetical protein Mapa_003166 [Marchantia paleacea]|nr:hypothetical protein Mapa_003166 [Marchantia paleacea]